MGTESSETELTAEALEEQVAEETAQAEAAQEEAAETAAFEAGFSGNQEAPAAKAEEKSAAEAKPAEPVATAPAAPPADDRYAKLEQRLRAVEGRNGTLIAQNKQLTERFEAATKPAPKQPTASQMMAAAMAGGSKMKGLQKEFPEFSDAMDELARITAQTIEKRMVAEREAMGKPGQYITAAEVDRRTKDAMQQVILDVKHPTWQDEVRSAEFYSWYQIQDDATRALAASDSASDAMKMIELFHSARKPAPAQQNSGGILTGQQKPVQNTAQQRLQSAIPATTSASRTTQRDATEEEDFQAGFKSARGG